MSRMRTDVVIDWALPDQLAFATVSALLHVASSYPEHRKAATDGINAFVKQIVEMLQKGDCTLFFALCRSNTEAVPSVRHTRTVCTILPRILSRHHVDTVSVVYK